MITWGGAGAPPGTTSRPLEMRSTLHHAVRERTAKADGARVALQTSAEHRHLTPCSSSPEDKRPAVPSTQDIAVEPWDPMGAAGEKTSPSVGRGRGGRGCLRRRQCWCRTDPVLLLAHRARRQESALRSCCANEDRPVRFARPRLRASQYLPHASALRNSKASAGDPSHTEQAP
jgi:hypothetical protein